MAFIRVSVPADIDLMAFVRAAGEAKVAGVPGPTFLPQENTPCTAVRLNFSAPTNQQIVEGVERLGRVLDRFPR